MTPKAIAKLRRTFIIIAAVSFLVVITFMGFMSFAANVRAITGQAERTIDAIIDAGGNIPREDNFHNGPFHEEASYGLRFFTVFFDSEGNIVDVDLSHIKSVDRSQAEEIAEVASDPHTISGFGIYENYVYKEADQSNGNTMAVFLDSAVEIANTKEVGLNTISLCAIAFLVVFASVVIFSKRAIRPEVEAAERQQRFVTNASHELKTPIAVIRANTELTEMLSGETEWTQSTMRQVDRLDRLVRDLMTIARGAERENSNSAELSDIDASSVVREATDSFSALAQQRELGLESDIAEGVRIKGEAKSIEQLTCLLVDNALKYCDANGTVSVSLSSARLGRGCTLVVSNDYAEGAHVDYQRFFDRFYREDEAHENQQGYGVGLSVAESICKSYHGSIKASWKAGKISFTCQLKDA